MIFSLFDSARSFLRSGPDSYYCYVLWVADTHQYYVGHAGDLDGVIEAHFRGRLEVTRGLSLRVLWTSFPVPGRREAVRYEDAVKDSIQRGSPSDFHRLTGLRLVSGASLLEYRLAIPPSGHGRVWHSGEPLTGSSVSQNVILTSRRRGCCGCFLVAVPLLLPLLFLKSVLFLASSFARLLR